MAIEPGVSSRPSRRRWRLGSMAAVASLTLAACGGGGHHSSTPTTNAGPPPATNTGGSSTSTTNAGGPSTTASGGPAGASTTASTPATTAPPGVATTAPRSTAVPTTVVSPTTLPPATTAVASRCDAASLSGSFAVILGSQGAGNVAARLVLTNHTASPCTTGGYVGLQLVGSNGASLPTNVQRAAGVAPGANFVLGPGASASMSARFSPDVPGPGDSQTGACQPSAAATLVIAPNGMHQFQVPGPASPVCERGTLSITPLQAGTGAG